MSNLFSILSDFNDKSKDKEQLNMKVVTQIAIAFCIIFILKWQVLNQPPVWDTAFSVFPAAITLSENGYDLLNLLKMPGMHDGGPNVHSNSIITIITALIISLYGKTNILFPLLHIIHFIIAAIGLTYFYRFCIPVLGRNLSFLLTLTTLVYPPFLTQTGYLYLEVPTFMFSILCLSAWTKGNYFRTIVFAILATLCKESGIIVAVTVASAAFLEPVSFKKRLLSSLSILAIPTILIAVSSLLIHTQGIKIDYGSLFKKIIYLSIISRAIDANRYLLNTPDLLISIILFLTIIPFKFRYFWHGLTDSDILNPIKPESIAKKHVSLSVLFLVCFFGFHYIALPLFRNYPDVLTRYYILSIPFLFLTIFWWLAELRVDKRTLYALLILSLTFFYLNKHGSFYPNHVDRLGIHFSIAERSAEYTDLLFVQQKSIRSIEKIAQKHPVFYGLPIHYLTKYPLMGYSSAPLVRGHCIYLDERYRNSNLEDFPSCFFMLKISAWWGGEVMQDLFEKALSSPDYSAVRVKLFSKGRYYSQLFRINRRNEPCVLLDEQLLNQSPEDNELEFIMNKLLKN